MSAPIVSRLYGPVAKAAGPFYLPCWVTPPDDPTGACREGEASRRVQGQLAGGEIYWKDLGEAEVPADAAEAGVGNGSSGTTSKRGRKPKGPSGPTYYVSKMVNGRRYKVSTGADNLKGSSSLRRAAVWWESETSRWARAARKGSALSQEALSRSRPRSSCARVGVHEEARIPGDHQQWKPCCGDPMARN